MEQSGLNFISHGLKISELWFDEILPPNERPDVVRYVQCFIQPEKNVKCIDFYTLISNLCLPEDVLWGLQKQGNHYEIRRASEKDGFKLEVWDGISETYLNQFICFYNNFALRKGVAELNIDYVLRLVKARRFEISRCLSPSGIELIYHGYYINSHRVRLLYSASSIQEEGESSFRAIIGRANRWFHWQDMLRFKAAGFKTYDWGGWYSGDEDAALIRINQFKSSFGGVLQLTFSYELLLTRKAKLFALIAKVIGKR